jgi:hypothetical protein
LNGGYLADWADEEHHTRINGISSQIGSSHK